MQDLYGTPQMVFHDFQAPRPDSRDFPGLENVTFEFQDFPQSVWTL